MTGRSIPGGRQDHDPGEASAAWEAPRDFGWVTQYNDQGEMQGFICRSDLPPGHDRPDQPDGDARPSGGRTSESEELEADGPDEGLFQ